MTILGMVPRMKSCKMVKGGKDILQFSALMQQTYEKNKEDVYLR